MPVSAKTSVLQNESSIHLSPHFGWNLPWDKKFFDISASEYKQYGLEDSNKGVSFKNLSPQKILVNDAFREKFLDKVDLEDRVRIFVKSPPRKHKDWLTLFQRDSDPVIYNEDWIRRIKTYDVSSDDNIESSKHWGWIAGGLGILSAGAGGLALRHNLQQEAKKAAHEQLLEARKTQFRQQVKLGTGIATGIGALALLIGGIASRRALQNSELDLKKSAFEYAQRFEGGFEVFDHKNIPTNVTLNTLIGHDAVKEKLYNLLKKMAYPQLSRQFYPEGHVLKCALVGPPGTGKTQAIRALTNEINQLSGSANAVMIKVNGALLSGKDGAGMLRQLRNRLNEMPRGSTAIIFMDEADSIPKKGKGSVDDDRVVNQLQELIDGVNGIKSGVNVAWFFASNMLEKLEPALISRIGQEIMTLDRPGPEHLKTMLQSFFRKAYLQPGFNLDFDTEAAKGYKLGLVGRDVNDMAELLKSTAVSRLDPRQAPPDMLTFTREDLDNAFQTASNKIKVMAQAQQT
jgi:AAA+ superfamily predicted ATPase